jgi:hypothetical protein
MIKCKRPDSRTATGVTWNGAIASGLATTSLEPAPPGSAHPVSAPDVETSMEASVPHQPIISSEGGAEDLEVGKATMIGTTEQLWRSSR